MKTRKILSFFTFLIFFGLFFVPFLGISYGNGGQELTIKYEAINPGSPFYVFKRFIEKIKVDIFARQGDQKTKQLIKLLDVRFKELIYVANDNIGYLEDSVSRYNYIAGTIMSNNQDLKPEVKSEIYKYISPLEKARDKFPANSAQWLLLQYAIDTTKRLL